MSNSFYVFSKPIFKQHLFKSLEEYFFTVIFFLFGGYNKISIIWTVLSQKENSVHAIQDPSHYYSAENNDRNIQSNDLNEDFEGALLDLYENLVKSVKLLYK